MKSYLKKDVFGLIEDVAKSEPVKIAKQVYRESKTANVLNLQQQIQLFLSRVTTKS